MKKKEQYIEKMLELIDFELPNSKSELIEAMLKLNYHFLFISRSFRKVKQNTYRKKAKELGIPLSTCWTRENRQRKTTDFFVFFTS